MARAPREYSARLGEWTHAAFDYILARDRQMDAARLERRAASYVLSERAAASSPAQATSSSTGDAPRKRPPLLMRRTGITRAQSPSPSTKYRPFNDLMRQEYHALTGLQNVALQNNGLRAAQQLSNDMNSRAQAELAQERYRLEILNMYRHAPNLYQEFFGTPRSTLGTSEPSTNTESMSRSDQLSTNNSSEGG